MSGDMVYIWDEELRFYDIGPGHPHSPIRNVLAYKLTDYLGVLARPNVTLTEHVEPATDDQLAWVHEVPYIDSVRRASDGTGYRDLARGLGSDDVPIFAGMHQAAARVCGATISAVRAVQSGAALHAVNISGGLHHAMPGSASGFCIYNDPAVGIEWLLRNSFERIAYVDVDVHHGDGVQEAFYNDPRVLTVSIHESGRYLFPGTGRPDEVGGPDARGSAVNIALPSGVDDNGWLRAFDAIVPKVLRAFQPQILVTQQGCDSHRNDPLANLNLTVDGQRASYLRLHELAHELCGGRWVALGGGGYDWLDAVPRAWTHLAAIAAGKAIDVSTETPMAYRSLLQTAFGVEAPATMGDGALINPHPWSAGYDMLDPLDRAVLKTEDAVYPEMGLVADPYMF
ncbi:MAG: acetoin utilization protein AcuC [Candidatus Nanopelagicales bacterium]